MNTETGEIDTGRAEWDEDYRAKEQETKEQKTKGSLPNADPKHLATQSLGLGAATNPHNQLQPRTSVVAPQFRARDNLPVKRSGPPSFSDNNGLAPRAKEWKANQATAGTTKKYAESKKSKQGWAEHPGLITTRKSNQIALDAASNKYLGPVPENTDFRCTGYFGHCDPELIASQNVDKAWDPIRIACRVYISLDVEKKTITVEAETDDECTTALGRIRITLFHAEANERTCRARYIVEPPTASTMRKEVLGVESGEISKDKLDRRVKLDGAWLGLKEMEEWKKTRKEFIASNEKVFADHLRNAFINLCALNSSMRMRVQFGTIILKRYRAEMTNHGFTFEKFVNMMGQSRTGANFEKMVGEIELGFQLIKKIHERPDMFCPLDNMIGNLSDIKPKQSLIYRKCGNASYRLEADIDITTRGDEYQLGQNSLYKEDTALKKRLEVGFLSFNSKFHWALEIMTQEKLSSNSVTIQRTAQQLLADAKVEHDIMGFPYPTLGHDRRLDGKDTANIHTMFQYKLMGTPYVVQILLSRGIGSDTTGYCGASMYSRNWDDHMGPEEGEICERWKLGSDLRVLFPPPQSSQPSASGGRVVDKHEGFRDFLSTVEKVQCFLSEAASGK
ncbi:hypothetical protein V495_01988 [Pseudogymnoascus sp. VKM F-4514 (FW-929)]|nr:hypothetical protein V495_01988 [Pseudogymnoascus sp. VKM F-4514 (FW-929)]KFY62025.1 hypothetical protein V497_02620 [Pseudogymnoascus sp. VKM F-4516 (FW-969)]